MAINYTRHFLLLLIAVASLFLGTSVPLSDAILVGRFETYYALVGLLHALTLVMALRTDASVTRRLAFVLIATALSIGAPYGGFAFAGLLGLHDEAGFFSIWAAGSAVGAVAYWLLIRAFWMPHLAFRFLLQTLLLCVGSTLASLIGGGMISGFGARPNAVSGELPTIFWWAAFSFSLFLADRGTSSTLANKGMEPTVPRAAPRLVP